MSSFFSYFSWFQIVLLMVGLMSGIFSLFREVVLINHPEKAKDGHLFWRCVFIAFIVSSVWLWISEHQQTIALQQQLDAFTKPKLEFSITTVALGDDPATPNVPMIIVQGDITNAGEMPSIVRTWSLAIQLPDGKYYGDSSVAIPSGDFKKLETRTANGGSGRPLDFEKDYLPNLTAREPVKQGGGFPGFIMFHVHGADRQVLATKGIKFILCYEDITHNKPCTPPYTSPGLSSMQEGPPVPGMHY